MKKTKIAMMTMLLLSIFTGTVTAQEEELDIDFDEAPGIQEAWGILNTMIYAVQFIVGASTIWYGAKAGATLQGGAENPQKVQEARKTLMFAILGLIIVIAAPWFMRNHIVEPYLFNID